MDMLVASERREAEIEELALAVAQRASRLRASLHSVLVRHRARGTCGRVPQRPAPTEGDRSRARTNEQTQIDHEARHCARRMAQDAVLASSAH